MIRLTKNIADSKAARPCLLECMRLLCAGFLSISRILLITILIVFVFNFNKAFVPLKGVKSAFDPY
jgi:hypothetical protein